MVAIASPRIIREMYIISHKGFTLAFCRNPSKVNGDSCRRLSQELDVPHTIDKYSIYHPVRSLVQFLHHRQSRRICGCVSVQPRRAILAARSSCATDRRLDNFLAPPHGYRATLAAEVFPMPEFRSTVIPAIATATHPAPSTGFARSSASSATPSMKAKTAPSLTPS